MSTIPTATSSPKLRPYQKEAIQQIRQSFRAGKQAPLYVLPTGAGKTILFSQFIKTEARKGKRILVPIHRRELIKQTHQKLVAAGVRCGVIGKGFQEWADEQAPVQLGSVHLLRSNPTRYGEFDLLVLDEAHHVSAASWQTLLKANPNAKVLGVTATPERLDGKGLHSSFDSLIVGPSIVDLQTPTLDCEQGYLSKMVVYAPSPSQLPDFDSVKRGTNDYSQTELAKEMNQVRLVGNAVEHFKRICPQARAMAFCVSIEHAQSVAEEFNRVGIPSIALSGKTALKKRDEGIAAFRQGKIQVLASCDLFGEGVDVPAVDAVILLRPTQSLGLYLQQVGRGLRLSPGKEKLIVLDHAGNCLRLGMPDTCHQWSLEGRQSTKKASPSRHCPDCGVIHDNQAYCPECHHKYDWVDEEVSFPRQILIESGTLEERENFRQQRMREINLVELCWPPRPLSLYLEIGQSRDELGLEWCNILQAGWNLIDSECQKAYGHVGEECVQERLIIVRTISLLFYFLWTQETISSYYQGLFHFVMAGCKMGVYYTQLDKFAKEVLSKHRPSNFFSTLKPYTKFCFKSLLQYFNPVFWSANDPLSKVKCYKLCFIRAQETWNDFMVGSKQSHIKIRSKLKDYFSSCGLVWP